MRFAYTGSYTYESKSFNCYPQGDGVHVYSVSDDGLKWDEIQTVPESNPAFIGFDAKKCVVYVAQSNSPVPVTGVVAYSRDAETGKLTKMSKQLDLQRPICCFSIHPSNRFMVAADFKGIVHVIALDENGALDHVAHELALPGELGPLPKDQKCSRPHHIPFDLSGNFLVIPDKGYDVVHLYRFDAENGELVPIVHTPVRPASCARHIAFHPNGRTVYMAAEYTSKIYVFDYDPEHSVLEKRQIISAERSTYCGLYCKSSEIAVLPNGKFLYVSNRGDNTIGIFAIGDDGLLTPVAWQDTLGEIPRFFCMDEKGKYLYVGNQKSGTVAVFAIDAETGALTPRGKPLSVPCPTWILFA